MNTSQKKIMQVLNGQPVWPLPIWVMRQAGRYLPEYRQVRSSVSGFLELCYTPKLAAEVTLQPIRRFGFDAAILFSDILVIPDALGLKVSFVENEGPKLDQVLSLKDLSKLEDELPLNRLDPVFETLDILKTALPSETTLLGFCGAPWTVASYMIAGKGTPDQAPARILAYQDPEFMDALIDRLVRASTAYLIRQIDAGAEAVQIFESFGSALPPALFDRLSLKPIERIVKKLKEERPAAKAIVFVRGGGNNLEKIAAAGFADAIALDWGTNIAVINQGSLSSVPTQGNLDPLALVAGGSYLDDGVDVIRKAARQKAHIFNLGHGIVPQTPIEHVEQLIKKVREA
ncbi:uroporphyrinogen decarboxylase [Microvirga sp. W0021]|uniref:Uroporphyrinogen decarboxylase n=1 Tax=Hohaiivirga grylli TaxID=3133970 RepID=A0ABV0BFB9_9HYPH